MIYLLGIPFYYYIDVDGKITEKRFSDRSEFMYYGIDGKITKKIIESYRRFNTSFEYSYEDNIVKIREIVASKSKKTEIICTFDTDNFMNREDHEDFFITHEKYSGGVIISKRIRKNDNVLLSAKKTASIQDGLNLKKEREISVLFDAKGKIQYTSIIEYDEKGRLSKDSQIDTRELDRDYRIEKIEELFDSEKIEQCDKIYEREYFYNEKNYLTKTLYNKRVEIDNDVLERVIRVYDKVYHFSESTEILQHELKYNEFNEVESEIIEKVRGQFELRIYRKLEGLYYVWIASYDKKFSYSEYFCKVNAGSKEIEERQIKAKVDDIDINTFLKHTRINR